VFSHVITSFYLALMIIVLTILLFILYVVRLVMTHDTDKLLYKIIDKVVHLFKAGGLAILLTLWWTVPFFEYFVEGSLNFSGMGSGTLSSCTVDFLSPFQNLKLPINMSFGDLVSSVFIVVSIVAIIYILIVRYLRSKKDIKTLDKAFYDDAWCLIISILFFVIYIYYYLASRCIFHFQTNGIDIVKNIYAKQQLSFRELGRGGVFLSLSIGYILTKVCSMIFKNRLLRCIPIYMVLITMVLSTGTYLKNKLDTKSRVDEISNTSLSDYQFKGYQYEKYDDMGEVDDGKEKSSDAIIEIPDAEETYTTYRYKIYNYNRGYLSINFDYEKKNGDDEKVMLHKNAYTGYEYYIDGVKNDFTRLPNGRPIVTLKGDKGHVVFKFVPRLHWTIALMISVSIFLMILIKRIIKEIKAIINIERGNLYEKNN
ncbi:MAG: hypothetical protein MJ151_03340, partial [Lachnospiraceae bacterium]|nr:hypothetical protein [Lachnospiraceae bacterium]